MILKRGLHIAYICLIVAGYRLPAYAQDDFRWPRDRAFEAGAGAGISGGMIEASYVRFFQPKKIAELPFKKRYNLLTGRDRYVAFPCKRKPSYRIPPGLSAKLSLLYELGGAKGYRYQVAGAEASLLYIILHKRDLYISFKGGLSVSNNRLLTPVNEGNVPNYYNRFKYGVLGGVEMDRILDRKKTKSIVLGWQEYRLLKGDSWGTTRWYAFIGLRYKIQKKERA